MPETPGNQSYKRFADPPLIRPDFSRPDLLFVSST